MKRIGGFLFAFAMTAGLAAVAPQPARATAMVATLCTVAVNPCPAPGVLDTGGRTNFVNVLGANRFAVMPFSFVDASASVQGTVVVANFASRFIYLVGFGAASSNGGPWDVDIAISQNYATIPGLWTFKGFNIGACNAAATGAGDGVTSLPYVNNIAMGGAVSSPCSPFAQGFGPKAQAVGAITNLTAAAIFGFNGGAAEPQVITLPWGDDIPNPDFTNLDVGPTTTLSEFEDALKSDGLVAEVPEPMAWALLLAGLGLAGFMLRRRQTAVLA
jgi:hypothetical protein